MNAPITKTLSRYEADVQYFIFYCQVKRDDIIAEAQKLSDTELQQKLGEWSDEISGKAWKRFSIK